MTVTNTTSIIDAYSVRAYGLDPQWVTVTPPRLSLFPGEVGTIEISIALPPDFPAGLRQLAVHVQSENDPAEFSLAQIALDVGARTQTTLRVDPVLGHGRQQGAVLADRRQRRQLDGAAAPRRGRPGGRRHDRVRAADDRRATAPAGDHPGRSARRTPVGRQPEAACARVQLRRRAAGDGHVRPEAADRAAAHLAARPAHRGGHLRRRAQPRRRQRRRRGRRRRRADQRSAHRPGRRRRVGAGAADLGDRSVGRPRRRRRWHPGRAVLGRQRRGARRHARPPTPTATSPSVN